jgi:hypothetical protein
MVESFDEKKKLLKKKLFFKQAINFSTKVEYDWDK